MQISFNILQPFHSESNFSKLNFQIFRMKKESSDRKSIHEKLKNTLKIHQNL